MFRWVGRPVGQTAAGQADVLTGVPGRPVIEVRAAALFVLRDVRGDVQGSRGDDEVLRIVCFVGSRGDAPGTVFLLVGEASASALTLQPLNIYQPLNHLRPMVSVDVQSLGRTFGWAAKYESTRKRMR